MFGVLTNHCTLCSAPRDYGEGRHRPANRSTGKGTLRSEDFIDNEHRTARRLSKVRSIKHLTLDDVVCVLRCYVTLRLAQLEPFFFWDSFVADVFGVHGDARAVENGKRKLKEIHERCSDLFDRFLAESAEAEMKQFFAEAQRGQ